MLTFTKLEKFSKRDTLFLLIKSVKHFSKHAKMFEDLKEQLTNFYDLSTDENEKISKEIIRRAKANKAQFGQYFSDLDYGMDSPKEVMYEALHSDAHEFEDIILGEIKQVINQAESGDEDAEGYLMMLYYLADLEEMTDEFYEKSLTIYFEKLDSPIAEVRYNCLDAIIDVADASGKKLKQNQISKIQKILYDNDFKVKMNTYMTLRELEAIPRDFKFSFFDKIRGWLTGYSKYMKKDSGYKKK